MLIYSYVFRWLNTFLYNCDLHEACHVDFVAVHWYNKAAYVDDFKNWIDRVCTLAHPRKVWLTEVSDLISHLIPINSQRRF